MSKMAPLLVSAMMTSCLVLGFGNVAKADPVHSATGNGAISPVRLEALARTALMSPVDRPIHQLAAVPLGLTSPGVPYVTKQISFREGAAAHVLAVHVSGTGKLLFMFVEEDGDGLLWACDRNGKLLAAGQAINRVFSPIALSDARSAFEAELRQWSEVRLPGDPVP